MKYHTLRDVPIGKLRKWLASAEKLFGLNCPTAKIYRTELRRRMATAKARKGVDRG